MFKFNMFNKFISKINDIKKQKSLLDSLKPGDLVWAKMPLSKKELNKIPESHQVRPYLIIYKDKFNLYAFPSSSKQSKKLNNFQEYLINKIHYKKIKNSFIDLTKIYKIPFVNLKSKYIKLNNLDLKNIQKRLVIQYNNQYDLLVNIYISEGDVISVDKKLYYVYACDNVYLYCILIYKKVNKDKKKYKNIIINNKSYYADFKEKISFKRTEPMNIVNIAYKSEIKEILNKKSGINFNETKLSNHEKKLIENTSIQTYESGTVFQFGKRKIVYLFKYKQVYYGIDLLMYSIKPKLIPIFDIEQKAISEVLSLEKLLKIVDFLNSNNIQHLKEINELYVELRTAVYN